MSARRNRQRLVPLLLAFVALAGIAPTAIARPHRHKRPRPVVARVRTVPVRFSVVNDNTSMVPCGSDGRRYTVFGTLVLPAGSLPHSVTLYVHGLGYAGYFWHFTAVRGYDYAGAEASLGHASVVIDRLGYGASSIPAGGDTCVGSQASILHQVVGDLRGGRYTAAGTAPTFTRVGLVGHSAGGELTEIEAYSFRDVDALGLMEWADQSYSLEAYAQFGVDGVQCAGGGSHQVGSSARGYAAFGQSNAQYDALMFHDVDPGVLAAANSLRTLDPCGQFDSILTGVAIDLLRVGGIKVPIAYVYAGHDAVYGGPWYQMQEALYRSSPKVTPIGLPGAGHAVTLERSARTLQLSMSKWLADNGL